MLAVGTEGSKVRAPHRDDLATHSDGLMSGVAEEVSIDGDGLTLPLVGPAGVVPDEAREEEENEEEERDEEEKEEEDFIKK